MLSTAGMVVSEDSFGPVSDNAAGVAEMSGEFTGEAERVMVSLDAVGNTTKAITKGVAIGSAVIASVSLFGSFVETIVSQLGLHVPASKLFSIQQTQINVANPTIFIGLLIGGSVAFLFSSLAIRAVGRSAGTVVQEVRRQFREHPGIMDYTEKPEYGRVISICTAAAQRELVTPALLAVLTPVIVGFGINYLALGAFLAAAILTGQLMANFLSNSGGAWDNAKKYIEDGHEGGKGSEAHTAAVIGDTVGDPFKDTAGPALNPLIKVMNLVSLLILPAVITLRHHTGARLGIAGAGVVILIGAIAFSKRKSEGFGGEEEVAAIKAPDHARAPRPWRPDATVGRCRARWGHRDENAGHGGRGRDLVPADVDTGVVDPPRSTTTMAILHPLPVDRCPRRGQAPGHRRIARQGPHHRGSARDGIRGRVLGRPHPGPAPTGRRDPHRLQGRGLGAPGRRRRQRVQAPVRGGSGEEVGRGPAQVPAGGGERGLPGHRRGPRGRVDRVASDRGALAPGADQAHGLPRDHRGRRSSAPSRSGATSTVVSSTPRRPGASSTVSTATRCHRFCGRRSCPGCRRVGSRAWPPG